MSGLRFLSLSSVFSIKIYFASSYIAIAYILQLSIKFCNSIYSSTWWHMSGLSGFIAPNDTQFLNARAKVAPPIANGSLFCPV